MIVTTKTTVTFLIPEEKDKAAWFEAEHPDWNKEISTSFITFTRTHTSPKRYKERID